MGPHLRWSIGSVSALGDIAPDVTWEDCKATLPWAGQPGAELFHDHRSHKGYLAGEETFSATTSSFPRSSLGNWLPKRWKQPHPAERKASGGLQREGSEGTV